MAHSPRGLYVAGESAADAVVPRFDAAAKTLSVDKGGDIWEFSTDGLKDMKVKKGDKVTVYYTMTARKIERK